MIPLISLLQPHIQCPGPSLFSKSTLRVRSQGQSPCVEDALFVPAPRRAADSAHPQQAPRGGSISVQSTGTSDSRQRTGVVKLSPLRGHWGLFCLPCPHRGLHPRHGDPHGPGGGDGQALRHQGGRVEQLLHDAAHAQRLPPLDPVLPRAPLPQGQ